MLTLAGLVLTAQLESQTVARASRQTQGLGTTSKATDLLDKDLRRELEHEKTHEEDLYQANAALAWWEWCNERWQGALQDAPATMPLKEATEKQTRPKSLQDWSYVCAIRSAYVSCEYALCDIPTSCSS